MGPSVPSLNRSCLPCLSLLQAPRSSHPLRGSILCWSSGCFGPVPVTPAFPWNSSGTDTRPGLQGANWPPLWALQEEGARLPRSGKGKRAIPSPSKTVRHNLNQMPPELLGKELLAWEEGSGLFGLLLVSRRPGQKVRRCGFSPGPTAEFLNHHP